MARKATIAAFEKWIAEDGNEELVLDKIAGGLTLQKTALAVKQPYTCLHAYFQSTNERSARYEAARKSWADFQMDEALRLADEVGPDRDEVAKAKLQIDARQVQAKAYYRDRWGEKLHVEKTVDVTVSPALLGRARQLLNKISSSREPRLIEQMPAIPAKVEEGE